LTRRNAGETAQYTISSNPLLLFSLRPKYAIFLKTQFSNILSFCSFLDMRDQVSYPCKRTGKMTITPSPCLHPGYLPEKVGVNKKSVNKK
jgi:hypothetical protein